MSSIKILPIASGSTGNSMLLDLDGRTILIDLGVSASALKAALTANGYTFDGIEAVLITHTHSDHVNGVLYLFLGFFGIARKPVNWGFYGPCPSKLS